ncbi:hypothetical protein J6590_003680 [Homalodisca vitripennis]|nr:hypothetical protein J6590_003680 [Homalodisca vitripennis]
MQVSLSQYDKMKHQDVGAPFAICCNQIWKLADRGRNFLCVASTATVANGVVCDSRIKQRRAWLLLGWVTAERSCPCKQPACPAIGGGSEVTFNPLAPTLSVREGF